MKAIDGGCHRLQSMVGDQICISSPGKPYRRPSSTTLLAPTKITTIATAPTNVDKKTNTRCARYYAPKQLEDCNTIILKFGVSVSDFQFLNPSINQNCTNMMLGKSYCVQAVGDSKSIIKGFISVLVLNSDS